MAFKTPKRKASNAFPSCTLKEFERNSSVVNKGHVGTHVLLANRNNYLVKKGQKNGQQKGQQWPFLPTVVLSIGLHDRYRWFTKIYCTSRILLKSFKLIVSRRRMICETLPRRALWKSFMQGWSLECGAFQDPPFRRDCK